MELAVDQMIEMLPAALRLYPYQAKALRAKYDSLLLKDLMNSKQWKS
ncbi:hypothetical protein KHA80_14225 [Anaerobacillus sp. HL2]|nr:hypothetical protein KHA80_14225 [Anaerobacillus sp. HL2]